LLSSLGQIMNSSASLDDQSQALAVLEEGVQLSRAIGDMWALAEVCRHRGEVAFGREDLTGAEMWYGESLAAARAVGSPWNIAWTQFDFGELSTMRGDDQAAARLYEECLPMFHELGNAVGVGMIVTRYSAVLLRLGELDRSAKLLDDTLASGRVDWGLPQLMDLHDHRGQVAYAQSDLQRASHHFMRALRFGLEAGRELLAGEYPMIHRNLLSEIAVVAAAQGHYVHATRLFSHAPERFYFNKPNLVQAQISASLAVCRATLGDAAFETAWAGGQTLTLEQAVDEALGNGD
jgi:tetratricopeptide (TPR) repeat protein